MDNIEKALIAACKAFLASYTTLVSATGARPPDNSLRTQQQPVERSNGIPTCPVHDRVMKQGQYGFYCTAKEDDPALANAKGYCNFKAK